MLAEYESYKWFAFGSLTHLRETSACSQVKHFESFMGVFARALSTRANRLHWVLRVEGRQSTNPSSTTRTHLHFLLGQHKVTNSKKVEISPVDACSMLEKLWPHGRSHVIPYEHENDGLAYILKAKVPAETQDQVVLSKAISAYLLKRKEFWLKHRDKNDDFLVQMLWDLKQFDGGGVSFADDLLRV